MKLGDTDVTPIGLGTNRLTTTAVAFVRDAVAAGLNFIDTAHTYSGGQSEEAIGTALASVPGECVVATKGGWSSGRQEVIAAEIDESLRRLRTDVIPLYYLHRVDPATPLEESLRAIKDSQESGKIRHAGVSNVSIEQIERARQIVPIAAVQNAYNLSGRKYDDVVDYCAREAIVFVAYFPLRRGDGARPVARIAEGHGATPAQIALAWLLRRSPTLLPIPGTLSLEHLKENLAALDVELSDEELQALQ